MGTHPDLNIKFDNIKMKLFAIFNLATAVFGLECLTCHGRDQGDCEANGRIVTCQDNEETCQVTTRHRDGASEMYQSMCKQLLACQNNSKHNPTECFPDATEGPSVFRSCTPDEPTTEAPPTSEVPGPIVFEQKIISSHFSANY